MKFFYKYRDHLHFCFFCAELMDKGNISRHCRANHNKSSRALKFNEVPPDPMYINWREWVEDPARTIPFKCPLLMKPPAELDLSNLLQPSQSQPTSEIEPNDLIYPVDSGVQESKSQPPQSPKLP